MPATFPASHNGFVPNHEASGKLVVDFSRNVKDFALNKYAQIVTSKDPIGLYLEMTVEEAGRILNTNLSDLVWPDGNDAPAGTDGTESFQFRQYRLERYAPSFRLGELSIEHTRWDIVAQHAKIHAQQAMTARTQLAITALTTSGSYDSTHRSAVASISGNTGTWAQSTTARQDIKRSFNTAYNVIKKDTLAAIKAKDMMLVIGPDTAMGMSLSQEIIDYIKGSPDALAQVRGELPGRNLEFGLPDRLYGVEIVIEDAVKVTNKKGATKATSYVLGSGTAVMCSRPGGLEGVANAPSFSTLTLFVHEKYDMAVEQWNDVNNKRTVGRVVDMHVPILTAPVSGYLFTSAV